MQTNKKKNSMVTFPNILSLSRIILSLLLFLMNNNKYIFLTTLLVIGLTDILDGYIARKYKIETILGAWLDSIGDFVFYISCFIYMILFELNFIIQLKYYIIVILIVKLLSLITGLVKFRKIGSLHTIGNKFSGLVIFIGICIFVLFRTTIIIKIGLYISIISSLEELLILIFGKQYDENIRGIYKILKKG